MYDIVTLRTRTGKNEIFMAGGAYHTIDVKKGLKIPRSIAHLAIEQNALGWSKENGEVCDSTVYIEDDLIEGEEKPKLITAEEVKAIKKTSGIGKQKVLVDGKAVPMKTIELDPVD